MFRMPATTVFLTKSRVLGADDPHAPLVEERSTYVAPNALANLIEPAFLDLLREERVRDRRTSRTNDVDKTRSNHFDHHVRVGKSTDRDYRLFGMRSYLLDIGPLV